ncbi:MAG: molybdate ABC transporter substrate-binding protein [Rhodoferax sp.]|uniref:molybdate ABC transporter substrate-binding protein n=1 Tax=Rhodoferax sp. TaxID=50421 RepID=UPI0026109BAA|nr:molybdate ABC transporter substrate-binding protein [Rhodoferax sp.]MDD5334113.1 molybdate ABC transporter substrate-binding protein [Rhodoferax sp.]
MTKISSSAALLAIGLALAGCASPGRTPVLADEPAPALQVYAAGSLRGALTAIAGEYQARTGQKIAFTFGPSGLLRERIEKGEPAQLFASADTEHPQRLAARGGWQTPSVFVRNGLCALTSEKIDATAATLLDTLLRPEVRVGASTPKSDPSGDYTWALFRKADGLQAGAYARLDAKTLKLAGGADSPKPPDGISAYGWLMDQGRADVFLTYCTNAVAAQKEVPRLKVVPVPPELQVAAAYGLTLRSGASPAASAFAQALLAAPAQAVFQRFGFAPP